MKLNAWVFYSLLATVFVSATPAMAQSNLSFMSDSPFTYFTPEDHKIFGEARTDILSKGADGESRKWSNPATTASGSLKVMKTFKRADVTCRTLHMSSRAKGRTASGQYNFCEKTPGTWTDS
ncbi:MAG: RT0821/Lpp0805 family surface protein [Betaproteobacteria bacterium]